MLSCKDVCKISCVKAVAKTKNKTKSVKAIEKDVDSSHFHVKETTSKIGKK